MSLLPYALGRVDPRVVAVRRSHSRRNHESRIAHATARICAAADHHREGGPGDAAFLVISVISGLVAVQHKDPESGVEFVLAELGAGQMFGEMALIDLRGYAARMLAEGLTTIGKVTSVVSIAE